MIISFYRTYVKHHSVTQFLAFFLLGVAVGDGAGTRAGDFALLSNVSSAVSESSWLGALGLGKILAGLIVHHPCSVGAGRCSS